MTPLDIAVVTQRITDVVTVGGTITVLGIGEQGPPGPPGAVAIAPWEVPGGTVNGSNNVFALSRIPNGFLLLLKNGLVQRQGAGNDYALSGAVITFQPGATPVPGDQLLATYTV